MLRLQSIIMLLFLSSNAWVAAADNYYAVFDLMPAGSYGGTCRCPDDTVYQVGAMYEECGKGDQEGDPRPRNGPIGCLGGTIQQRCGNNRVDSNNEGKAVLCSPDNFEWKTPAFGKKRYLWIEIQMEYEYAVALCNLVGGDGNDSALVTIESEDEQNYIIEEVMEGKDDASDDTWIGCNDMANEGDFKWSSDGSNCEASDAKYVNWYRTEPNNWEGGGVSGEDCAIIRFSESRNGQWDDVSCTFKNKVVCQSTIPTTTTTTTTSATTATVTTTTETTATETTATETTATTTSVTQTTMTATTTSVTQTTKTVTTTSATETTLLDATVTATTKTDTTTSGTETSSSTTNPCRPYRLDRRCGPLYGGASCATKDYEFCNEDSGWCGKTPAHQDAQESDTYDWCEGADGVDDSSCSLDTLGDGKCPPVDTVWGKCGPLKGCFACKTKENPFCNEAEGYCGSGADHEGAQSSTTYDFCITAGPCAKGDRVEAQWNSLNAWYGASIASVNDVQKTVVLMWDDGINTGTTVAFNKAKKGGTLCSVLADAAVATTSATTATKTITTATTTTTTPTTTTATTAILTTTATSTKQQPEQPEQPGTETMATAATAASTTSPVSTLNTSTTLATTVGVKVVGASTAAPAPCSDDCAPVGCADAWCRPACSNGTYLYKREDECCEQCHAEALEPGSEQTPTPTMATATTTAPPTATTAPSTPAPSDSLDASADERKASIGVIVGSILAIIFVTVIGAFIARKCERTAGAAVTMKLSGDIITNPAFPDDPKTVFGSTYEVPNFEAHRKRMDTADAMAAAVQAAAAARGANGVQTADHIVSSNQSNRSGGESGFAGVGAGVVGASKGFEHAAAAAASSNPVYSEAHYHDSEFGVGSGEAEYAEADEAMAAMHAMQANGGRRPSYLVPGVGLQQAGGALALSPGQMLIAEYADPEQLRELDGHTGTITPLPSIGSLPRGSRGISDGGGNNSSLQQLLASSAPFNGADDVPEYADADEAMAAMHAMQANGGRRPSYLVPGVGLNSNSGYAGFGALGGGGNGYAGFSDDIVEEPTYADVPDDFEGDGGSVLQSPLAARPPAALPLHVGTAGARAGGDGGGGMLPASGKGWRSASSSLKQQQQQVHANTRAEYMAPVELAASSKGRGKDVSQYAGFDASAPTATYEYQESVVSTPVEEHVYASANIATGGSGGGDREPGNINIPPATPSARASGAGMAGMAVRGYMNLDPDTPMPAATGSAKGSKGSINLKNPGGSSKGAATAGAGGAAGVGSYMNLNPDGSAIGYADPVGYANQKSIQEHMLQRPQACATVDAANEVGRVRRALPTVPRLATQHQNQKSSPQLPGRSSFDGVPVMQLQGPQLKARKQVKANRRRGSHDRANGGGGGGGTSSDAGAGNNNRRNAPKLLRDNSFC